ncbi:O-methyltransferase [Atopobacter sp. AH10]|uniref:O-methyltransferase n=1 Tax=Atopobacter sp. AH10 TaxID=2315861 RepID=UPI000EF1E5D8|nr:O-methyltransferase [Atopobacter sp. AH10]RLK62916.1 O-methyltransferase [Atopobacter sp. AH10]
MLDRPIVMEKVVHYMRDKLARLAPDLDRMERNANERRVPIIPHETVAYLNQLVEHEQPKNILEVGTAIAFSAKLMAQYAPVTTIERNPMMSEEARKNIGGDKYPIELLEGQAEEILPKLEGPYDLIFMDSAKAKYISFLPDCLRLLSEDGILLIDDIFQGGTVVDPITTIPHRVKTIHRKLNLLLDELTSNKELNVSLLPLGDGLAVVTKKRVN